MAITVDTTCDWMPEKRLLDPQQLGVLDSLIHWAQTLESDGETQNRDVHWIRGFAGSGKTILLIYAMLQTLRLQPEAKICFVTYTSSLKDLVRSALNCDGGESANVFRLDQIAEEVTRNNGFDYAFVDEVQDVKKHHLKLLINMAKKIVVAGDPDQSIFTKTVTIDELIDALGILDDHRHNLSIMYRLPNEVVKIANTILPETRMIFAENGRRGDPAQIIATQYDNEQTEAETVYKYSNELAVPRKPSLILLKGHYQIYQFASKICKAQNTPPPSKPGYMQGMRDYSLFNKQLKEKGINLMYFGNDNGDLNASKNQSQVYIMTYHSAKGLDFPHVFLPSLNSDLTFWRDDENISKRLFFVGLTRTSQDLYLSFNSNEPHHYLKKITEEDGFIKIRKDDVRNIEINDDMPF